MKRVFITLLFLFGMAMSVFADHVVGSDIFYRCLGNGKYEITFKFYRDCNGCKVGGRGGGGTGANCGVPDISITGANGNCDKKVLIQSLGMSFISYNDITPLCGSAKSACGGGTFPYGIEEHIFKGVVDFSNYISQGCCKFKVSTIISVRSNTITTGAASQAFYTEAEINACDSICNSSPMYTSLPVAIICAGQDFVFNNGALDTADTGDSLSYGLATAYRGPNTSVSYSTGFSAIRPITFMGFPTNNATKPAGFYLDTVTGDLSFRPVKINETAVIVIEVVEWRRINGVMKEVGRTRRDMQVIVVLCNDNNVPRIFPPFTKNACVGQPICMDIETFDADSTRDTVRISWNGGIPGATFTENNGKVRFAKGKVCWTPGENHVSKTPHTFTITATDNACPLKGVSIRAFSIYVHESPSATRTYTQLTCGKVFAKAEITKQIPGGVVTEWRVKDSLGVTYGVVQNSLEDTIQLRPGPNYISFSVKTNIPCVTTMIDTIFVNPYVQVRLPDDDFMCNGETATIQSVTTFGTPPYHYTWHTSPTDTLTSFDYTATKKSMLKISVSDASGCSYSDSMDIGFGYLPYMYLDTGRRICEKDTLELDAGNGTFIPSQYTYLWNTGHTSRYYKVYKSGTYIAVITDTMGCTNTDTFNLHVNKVPVDPGPDRNICYGDTAIITVGGADMYNWYKLPDTTTVVSANDTLWKVITDTTRYRIYGKSTYNGMTCENTHTITIGVNPLPLITFTPIKDKCDKPVNFNLVEGIMPPTLTTGDWSCPDNPAWVQFNYFKADSVSVSPNLGYRTINLTYKVTDNNGCKKSANTTFKVIGLPEVYLRDTSLCSDKGKVDLKKVALFPTNVAPGTWQWNSPNTQAKQAIEGTGKNAVFNLSAVSQDNSYALCLTATNLSGCINTGCMNLTSRRVPVVNAGALTPVCENDTMFKLSQASPSPAGGIWHSPSGGVVFTDWFNPKAVTPGQTHTLFYTYDIPGNNCPVTDSLFLIIKSKPIITLSQPANACSDTGILNLMALVNPSGGAWSGVGATPAGSFDATQNTGVRWVRYDYTGPNGCSNYITTSFNVQEKPEITITQPQPACQGLPISLSADMKNAAGVVWNTSGDGVFSDYTSLNTIYTPGPADDTCLYFYLTTTGNGICKPANSNSNICIYPFPEASINYDPKEGCEPLAVNFYGVTNLPSGATYKWDLGEGPASIAQVQNPVYTYTENGTYTASLEVTSKDGCSKTADPVNVVVHPVPVAGMDADYWTTTVLNTVINFKSTSTIDVPGKIDSLLWSFGNPGDSTSTLANPVFEYPTDSGTYHVTLRVISDKGCENLTSRPLVVLPQLRAFIPNAFLPNGASEPANQRFWVTADGFKEFSVQIFSRWGELLYQSKNINEGWDGMFKGVEVQQDVYIYLVNFIGEDGKKYTFRGTVTLLR